MDVLEAAVWYSSRLLLCLSVLAFVHFWHWCDPRIYWKLMAVPRMPSIFTWIPVFGDTIFFAFNDPQVLILNFLHWLKNKQVDRACRAIILGRPHVFLFHADDYEIILGNTVNIKKGVEYLPFKPWLREGLLVSEGGKWKQRRKLLTPTFHYNILEDNVGQVFAHSQKFVEKLLQTGGNPVIVETLIKKYTLDVICDTAMGIKMNAQEDRSKDYLSALEGAICIVVKKTLKVWWQKDWFFNLTQDSKQFNQDLETLHKFTNNVIADRKEERVKRVEKNDVSKENPKALLDLLLELEELNPGTFTSLDIQEEVDTFMFEGHDTTSSAITFALYILANHPDIQERILGEQEQIFGPEDRELTLQDLKEMTYLEMVIKEVLRLYPPVPYLARQLQKDTVLGNGVVLSAGTNVAVAPIFVHYNSNYWDNPEEFRPERFLPGTPRHPYSYIPFSAGPRNCIGMKFAMNELKTTLSSIVRKCHLEAVTKTVKFNPSVILKNDIPTIIRVFPRVSKNPENRLIKAMS